MSDTQVNRATVTVILPDTLASLFPGSLSRIELPATSVADVINTLDARWPGMRDRLCDSTPKLRRRINVFVGGRRVPLEAKLAPGSVVHIMTGICEGG